MTDKDYSQFGEQTHILKFFAGAERGMFLSLGEFDGITGSNTRCLSDRGWSGVCIEPCADAFVRLVNNHHGNPNIKLVNAAVMPQNRRRVQMFHDAGDQIGTVYEDHRLGELVKRRWHVATLTPSDIQTSFGRRFEFVSVDIEGMDLPVIEALEPLLWETQLVCFEDAIPNCPFDTVYYEQLLAAWKMHGFTKLIGRTCDPSGKPANTLLARGDPVPLQPGVARPAFKKEP